jgi:hypothetical protein
MIEVCHFDPLYKEFTIRYTRTQQKEISSHEIMLKMQGYNITKNRNNSPDPIHILKSEIQ